MASSAEATGDSLDLVKPLVLAGVTVAVISVAAAVSQRYIRVRRHRPISCDDKRTFKKPRMSYFLDETHPKYRDFLCQEGYQLYAASTSAPTKKRRMSCPSRCETALYSEKESSPFQQRRKANTPQKTRNPPTVVDQPHSSRESTSTSKLEWPNGPLRFGVASSRDRSTRKLHYVGLSSLPINSHTSYFGLYEGHRGESAAAFLAKQLHLEIDKQLEVVESDDLQLCTGDDEEDGELKMGTRKEAIGLAFSQVDKHLLEEQKQNRAVKKKGVNQNACSGSSALCAIIYRKEKKVLLANLGSSRCIFSKGGHKGYVELSSNHRPTHLKELPRIMKAGLFVKEGRLDGVLGVSRAFGDFEFKGEADLWPEEQAVSNTPDFLELDVQIGEGQFLIIGSAAMWEVASSEEINNFVSERLGRRGKYISLSPPPEGNVDGPNDDLSSLAEELTAFATQRGCIEPISASIILLP